MKYILLAASTLDGKIAKHDKHFTDWTSPEDKQHLHKIMDTCDIIIVGNNTYKTAIKPLSKRNCLVLSKSIKKLKQTNNNLVYIDPENTNLKKYLTTQKYKTVCILGGTSIYSLALKNNMVDEIYLTIEPIIFGRGLNLFDINIKKRQFKLITSKKLNKLGSILLHYKK